MDSLFNNLPDTLALLMEKTPVYIAVMVVSGLCGLLIGLERESRGKAAGARTLVLICLGSAMFAHVSIDMAGPFGDPARIAAQIVSGIGFLGAGAILHQKERGYIQGLTTAATIWVTAAAGLIIGSGHYLFGLISTLFVVVALRLLRVLETYLFHERHIEERHVFFKSEKGKAEWKVLGLLEEHMIPPSDYKIVFNDEKERHHLNLRYSRSNRNHRSFMAELAGLKAVDEIVGHDS